MRLNISITGVFVFFLCANFLSAQDIHLSQYHFDRLQINPALTGIFNGDRQVSLIHKQQFFSVPVDYLTFSGSYDMKFNKVQNPHGFFSAGVLFNYDQAGDADLALINLSLNGSYTRALTRSFFVGLGAYVGGGQRSFNEKDLKWDNNWNGTTFVPGPSGETFDHTSVTFLDLGAGLNVRLQGKDRTKIDLGVGAFHLNEPGYNFGLKQNGDENIPLPARFSFHALGVLKLVSRLDLFGNGPLPGTGSLFGNRFGRWHHHSYQ
jgi:type IX secretion system PorP/SprF family membrane protein